MRGAWWLDGGVGEGPPTMQNLQFDDKNPLSIPVQIQFDVKELCDPFFFFLFFSPRRLCTPSLPGRATSPHHTVSANEPRFRPHGTSYVYNTSLHTYNHTFLYLLHHLPHAKWIYGGHPTSHSIGLKKPSSLPHPIQPQTGSGTWPIWTCTSMYSTYDIEFSQYVQGRGLRHGDDHFSFRKRLSGGGRVWVVFRSDHVVGRERIKGFEDCRTRIIFQVD